MKNKQIKSPQYKHDCGKCVFLGRFLNKQESYDLYFHQHTPDHIELVARYSSTGEDYSADDFHRNEYFGHHCEAIKETKERVKQRSK
jgi:hypothetical protein